MPMGYFTSTTSHNLTNIEEVNDGWCTENIVEMEQPTNKTYSYSVYTDEKSYNFEKLETEPKCIDVEIAYDEILYQTYDGENYTLVNDDLPNFIVIDYDDSKFYVNTSDLNDVMDYIILINATANTNSLK